MPTDNPEPQLDPSVKLTEKQAAAQFLLKQVAGLIQSDYNVLLFRNSPQLWFLYFAGLTLKMPTLIVLRHSDKEWLESLRHPLVKSIFMVHSFEKEEAHITAKIEQYIKKHPLKGGEQK